MDAKERAVFMNQRAKTDREPATEQVCENCGAPVRGKFCSKCGTPVGQKAEEVSVFPRKRRVEPYVVPERRPAPGKVRETGIFRSVQVADKSGEQSVFAQGLPEWSIEPPQVPVRRK